MGKPVVRLGIHIDKETWATLLKVEKFDGTWPCDFSIDTSEPTVWLYLVAETQDVVHRLNDVTTKDGGLRMKSAGEWQDSAEAFNSYRRSLARAKQVERRLRDAEGFPPDEHLAAMQELSVAARDRDLAKEVFEAALKEDTDRLAQDEEDLAPDHRLYRHLGPPN